MRPNAFLLLLLFIFSFAADRAAAQTAIVVGRDRIEVREAIPFPVASSTVPASSRRLLRNLAKALNENPQFTKVRIEGHTDSSGDPEVNRNLSQSRADAVRVALISAGVAPDRLIALGFGASDPLQSNATPVGRTGNRRVVFEVLQIGSEKVTRPPLAKVSAKRNKVNSRAPLEKGWRTAQVGDGLRRSWRVRTKRDSGAGITFRDASLIQMREETLVIIFGATEDRAAVKPLRASLETGALTAWLQKADKSDASLLVETPSGDAELTGGRAAARLASNGPTRPTPESAFSNHSGKPARVFGKTTSGSRIPTPVVVDKGFGSRVKQGSVPDAPVKLPPPPELIPGQLALFVPATNALAVLSGTWTTERESAFVIFQLTTVGSPEISPLQVKVPGTVSKFRIEGLAPGVYELQAIVVDAIGLESDLSAPHVVTVDTVSCKSCLETADETGTDVATYSVGDVLVVPDSFLCAVDDLSFDSPDALIVHRETTRLRCRGRSTTSAVAPEAVMALRVRADAPWTGTATKDATQVRIQLEAGSAVDDDTTIAVNGGKATRPQRTKGNPGAVSLVVRARAGSTIEVDVLRNGVSVQRLSLPLASEEAPTPAVVAPSVSWPLLLPIGIGVPVIAAGIAFIIDASLYQSTGGPYFFGDTVDRIAGGKNPALTAIVEGIAGVVVIGVGIGIVGMSVGLFVWDIMDAE